VTAAAGHPPEGQAAAPLTFEALAQRHAQAVRDERAIIQAHRALAAQDVTDERDISPRAARAAPDAHARKQGRIHAQRELLGAMKYAQLLDGQDPAGIPARYRAATGQTLPKADPFTSW